jgi:hypothetical protein
MTAIPHPTTMKAATPELSTLKQIQNTNPELYNAWEKICRRNGRMKKLYPKPVFVNNVANDSKRHHAH